MNRLAREKSPYLLQHRNNPVDWYPWGEDAFGKARREDKPIFLSIGYSTCHWCHVMERESFENPDVADFLNRHFVSIKVDREERPDVDRIYMTAVQVLSGQGGWPLSAFLCPEGKPFFGGTYFPPEDVHGRTGFLTVLRQITDSWRRKSADLVAFGQDLIRRLSQDDASSATAPLTPMMLDRAADAFRQQYDATWGGFGRAPKFPQPSLLAFLLRHGVRHGQEATVEMVLHTLRRMARGGIRDHIGGGFARYAVDAHWRVPHFEKMLYDNAQLACLYLDAWRITGEEAHARVVHETLGYVLRDMTHPQGGFYSAEDADSEGKEGKFYCWTLGGIRSLLGPEEAALFIRRFGLTPEGNFVDHSDPDPLRGQNVIHLADDRLEDGESSLLESARRKVFLERGRRVRPGLDDKILLSWNGLMLGAMARAGAMLGESTFLEAARRNFDFLRENLRDHDRGLFHHRWRDGARDRVQILQGYACFLSGIVDLHQATLESRYLHAAIEVADALIREFLDRERGGFWQSRDEDLILRMKDDHDGAEPSGNSVAALALLRLSAITDRDDYRQVAGQCLESFSGRLEQMPWAMPLMLLALDLHLDPPRRIVLHGDPASPAGTRLLAAVHSVYQPNCVVRRDDASRLSPAPFASLCTATACRETTGDPERIREFLRS